MERDVREKEALLIKSLKAENRKAFEGIYRMYAKRLHAYSFRFTRSEEISKDIVQEVFAQLWVNRKKIKQETSLSPLLFIMTKHYLINSFHSKINKLIYEDFNNYEDALFVDNAGHHLEYKDCVQKFIKVLERLPSTQQKVVTLSRIQQLSNKQIAEHLSLSEQTVKNQMSIALKVLRNKLHAIL
jgi:RNA polymerase sigma-70 factor (ECF subfamily)